VIIYISPLQGYDVRASIGGLLEEEEAHLMGGLMGGLEPGRVILAVNDLSMVDFFKMQVRVGPAWCRSSVTWVS